MDYRFIKGTNCFFIEALLTKHVGDKWFGVVQNGLVKRNIPG